MWQCFTWRTLFVSLWLELYKKFHNWPSLKLLLWCLIMGANEKRISFMHQNTLQVKCHPNTCLCVKFSHVFPVFTLLPPQPGCVTTNSCAAKMVGRVSATSAATVHQPTRACCVRSAAASQSWEAVGARIQARLTWHLHPPPGCCCCCC